LATIGATSPFVGLFGTVWGIMNSFIGISKSQTTNLAVVAPGIAEALLATAFGLAAAIPAVVIYNVFSRKIADYPQFPNKSQSTLTHDRFCGHEYLGTSHFRVVGHLPGLGGTHGESGHDRAQSARVALSRRAHGASPRPHGTAPNMIFGLGNVWLWLIRQVPAPAPG
jgi:hypothetical protein